MDESKFDRDRLLFWVMNNDENSKKFQKAQDSFPWMIMFVVRISVGYKFRRFETKYHISIGWDEDIFLIEDNTALRAMKENILNKMNNIHKVGTIISLFQNVPDLN